MMPGVAPCTIKIKKGRTYRITVEEIPVEASSEIEADDHSEFDEDED